ncbi:MAG: replicative DNA helicase [Patescibacteria group bacterium]
MPISPDRLPPQNLEAEQSVLGSLLIDKEAVTKVADFLRPDDFYRDVHGLVYETMLELYERKEPIDLLSLSGRLEEKKKLETVGGRGFLASLANVVPTASHVVHYGQIVQKKAILRKLIHAAAEVGELGFNESEDVDVVLDRAEQRLFSVSQHSRRQNFIPVKQLLTEAFDRIDELHRESGKLRGFRTGYKDLDNKLAGLQRSNLIIVAARPSMGKTSLAIDIARHIATQEHVPVGVFSLEMSKEELVDRMLCAEANVDLWRLRTGRLSDRETPQGESDFTAIGRAMGTLAEAPIYIDDSAILNAMEIRTKARRLHAETGLGFIVVDYLQLMESGNNAESRVQEVAQITRSLKALARELNIPVLAVSQLSRQAENRPGSIPRLADLRESGSIEQDADVVMFIFREEMYKPDTPRKHIAEIHIAKHRNGPTGMVELYFDAEKTSFKNLEKSMHTSSTPPPPSTTNPSF